MGSCVSSDRSSTTHIVQDCVGFKSDNIQRNGVYWNCKFLAGSYHFIWCSSEIRIRILLQIRTRRLLKFVCLPDGLTLKPKLFVSPCWSVFAHSRSSLGMAGIAYIKHVSLGSSLPVARRVVKLQLSCIGRAVKNWKSQRVRARHNPCLGLSTIWLLSKFFHNICSQFRLVRAV